MENNAIQIFSYKEQQVRTTKIDGEAWFIAKDVAGILEIQNIRQNLNALDEDEKGVYKAYTPSGKQTMTIISESGLYKLAFKSRKAEAKKFTRWVTHEILPEIYRKGYYAVPAVQSQIDELRRENQMLRGRCEALQKYVQENSSFTILGQAVTAISGAVSAGEAAKIFATVSKSARTGSTSYSAIWALSQNAEADSGISLLRNPLSKDCVSSSSRLAQKAYPTSQ